MGAGAHNKHESTTIEPAGTVFPYATPQALLAAITDKVAAVVATGSAYNHDELRRHLAYDRLLARVFSHDPERWLLKGGGALLARIPDARHSKDLDIAYSGDITKAAGAMAEAVAVDLGDFFVFRAHPVKATLTGLTPGVRVPIDARIGPKPFASFHLDLVLADGLTTTPDSVPPLSPINIDGLTKVPYRAYPLVDHLADKHAAMIETHNGQPSTRYRDLVDIVEIATTQRLDAKPVSVALYTKYRLRGLDPPATFATPGNDWPAGYVAVAKTVPALSQQTFEEAVRVAASLLEPILGGRNSGTWDPSIAAWTD